MDGGSNEAPIGVDESRDGAVLWRGVAAKVDLHLVDIAPAPALGRVISFNDGMPRLMKMRSGVAVGRVIATADMAACPTQSEMDPPAAVRETFFATQTAGSDMGNRGQMVAAFAHGSLLHADLVASITGLSSGERF